MTGWTQVTYDYDGSFYGFLTCVAEGFQHKEYPHYFLPPEERQYSLYPVRYIETDRKRADELYRALKTKFPLEVRQLVEYGFLTCLPQKERYLFEYLYVNFSRGALIDPTDQRVLLLRKAVQHLTGEAHLLKGFVRFSDHSGVLIGEITPKNRVLPLLRTHFCLRYPNEAFLLFDKTNKEALCHTKGIWKIIPLEELSLQEADGTEEKYRSLWRGFYEAIAIESRYNPKLRMSNMPKRYWANMTEFQDA